MADLETRGRALTEMWFDYRTLAGAKLRSDAQYRTSFVVMILVSLIITGLDFAAIAVIFTKTPALGGWSIAQVAFLYGTSAICFGTADFLVGSVESISPKVRDGSFDTVLLRPVNALVNLTASEFAFRRIGNIIQGGAVFLVTALVVDVGWTIAKVGVLIVAIVAGIVIASSTWVITSSVSFWTVNTQEVANSFTYGGQQATGFPLHVFDAWLRILVTYVVPLVFVNYLPALHILELDSPLGLPEWMRFASPLVAVGMVLIARMVWGAGIRHYRSTGS